MYSDDTTADALMGAESEAPGAADTSGAEPDPGKPAPKQRAPGFFRRHASSLIIGCLVVMVAGLGIVVITDKVTGKSIAAIADKAQDSVVEIQIVRQAADGEDAELLSSGSGIIISAEGYIITNNHVVEDTGDILVTLGNGKEYDGTLMGADTKADIAVVKINAIKLRPATLGDSDTVRVGDMAVTIGNPLGDLRSVVTAGIISTLDSYVNINGNEMSVLQTDAPINAGSSGGGLFNERGQLIGIVVGKAVSMGSEGLGFVIPVNKAMAIAQGLMDAA